MRNLRFVVVFFVPAFAWIAACQEDEGGATLTQQSAVSECGGFEDPGNDLPARDPNTYCDAEMLHWTHDGAARLLALANTRVSLNCCGLHTMTIALEDGVYVVRERDAPDGDRCRCMCVFDYTMEATGVSGGTISLRLEREVTDSGEGSELVWEGNVDLSDGAGSITVDASPLETGCHEI